MIENNQPNDIISHFKDAKYIFRYESKIKHDLLFEFLSDGFDIFKKEVKNHVEDIYSEIINLEEESTTIYKHNINDIYVSFQSYKKVDEELPFVWNLTVYFYGNVESQVEEMGERVLKMLSPLSDTEKNELITDEENLFTIDINTEGTIELFPIQYYREDTSFLYSEKTRTSLSDTIKDIQESMYDYYLLYGKEGTGKTSSIELIASQVKDKKFINIPIRLLESCLSSGNFLEYLRENNVVLVIDNIERLEHLYDFKTPSVLTSITELIGGLPSRIYNVELILIYNTLNTKICSDKFSKIGIQHFCGVSFDELTSSEANKIYEVLKLTPNFREENSYTLSEILNNTKNPSTIKKFGF